MTIPGYQSLMLPVLRYAAQAEQRVPPLAEKIAVDFDLSAAECEKMLQNGGQSILKNRIHWAKYYMHKAGLVDCPARGRFIASDAGKRLLATNPQRLDYQHLLSIPQFAAYHAANKKQGNVASTRSKFGDETSKEASTPEEQIEDAFAALNTALQTELLDRIRENSPAFFEQVIVDLLIAMGYGGSHKNAAEQLGRSGDGGVDGVINEDRLGLDRIYLQAKRHASSNKIGRPDMQAFVGSLVGFGATKGVFVTTSSFTDSATKYTRSLPQRVIQIDGVRLAELMIEHGVGTRAYRTIQVQRLDEDFFSEDG
ncbi:restriction endonuclease [uncultured Cohaesibacter sp.]|uniref:restriction endonuclease n=1 Tax=uncultured Cohaesibacter sp. TaxID=1002546 RepID=UPI0029C8CB05|nr:restriction endonuclease [uncultured Cohaesibacter sp.]